MDFFQTAEGAFNPVLILPVFVAVVGVIAVFIFGFKKPANPNFRKIAANEHSSSGAGITGSGSYKRQKRNVTAAESTSAAQHQPKNTVTAAAAKAKKEAAAAVVPTVAPAAVNNKSKPQAAPLPKGQAAKKTAAAAKTATNAKEKKSNARNAEKPLDDGGEWQTVVAKKQKKNTTTNDLLIQAVAEAAAGVSLTKSGSAKGNNAAILKNNKQAKEQANKTKKATADQQKRVSVESDAVVADNKSLEEVLETKTKLQIAAEPAAALVNEAKFLEIAPDFVSVPAAIEIQSAAVEISTDFAVEDPAVQPVQDTNLVFDELGDAAWTEAKTPKKSKKRALRE